MSENTLSPSDQAELACKEAPVVKLAYTSDVDLALDDWREAVRVCNLPSARQTVVFYKR